MSREVPPTDGDAPFYVGLVLATAVLALTSIAAWRGFGAASGNGFNNWVLATFATAAVLALSGIGVGAASRDRRLAYGLVGGAVLGLGLSVLWALVWVITQVGS